jgi:mannose-6-phosphate isomerase-like protein (cupin superfamily)
MATQLPEIGASDEVQIFDPGQILSDAARSLEDQLGLATSPNCDILLRQAPPGGALEVETDAHTDQIIFVLRGQCRMEAPTGEYELTANGGALVRSGTNVRCVNTGSETLALVTLRTGAGEERPGYVPNRPSGVFLRVPADEISARGLPRHLYVFAMSQRTIGIGTNATEEWNLGSLLRMNCQYLREGDDILVNLPERMVRWYRLRDVTPGDYRIISDPDRWRCKVDLTPLIEREAAARS